MFWTWHHRGPQRPAAVPASRAPSATAEWHHGLFVAVLVTLLAGGGCQNTERRSTERPTVFVSAAVSLSDTLSKVAAGFERATGTRVILNLAGSGLLATQLIEGALVDVFISADETQMNRVAAKALIRRASRIDLLSNQLVVVVPADRAGTVRTVRDLRSDAVRRVAMGDPDAVPAGVYARRYLESIGAWGALRGKIVPTRNVRAVLAAVEAGSADAGFVYRTDATTTSGVVTAFEVPLEAGPSIAYPAAVGRDAPNETDATRFLTFLQGAEARWEFEQAGFIVLHGA